MKIIDIKLEILKDERQQFPYIMALKADNKDLVHIVVNNGYFEYSLVKLPKEEDDNYIEPWLLDAILQNEGEPPEYSDDDFEILHEAEEAANSHFK
ncbi:hypothetical protein CDQ84_18235 [Clostridium thermosuccinogenes]|uniref:Uncharacterized protein n=1 Tax=Clostridium thermosuccinogenes TaxID=84032 RepID=A0A2K2EZL4_9CLOT|nr:hypothetical protein [Pseudoclostridium thermosuccinogenes]AUS95269.1 hypothetical protein CDO33_01695 [Pseudoclostridium thermosuccinogenes]PNT90666.1 hypothetical protein CDQ83_18705 [Pseudoclostridium thermosuccinogenes]PNT91966.1 hypothetical protein CDQ85_18195 [Pseudoclostridium thermosuccinogenes]PNT94844.1 hypothetical protein CDQ84_18235 [Pseudoclostridium thermosuccinogenes]